MQWVLPAAILLGVAGCAPAQPPSQPADPEPPITLPATQAEQDAPDALERRLAYTQNLAEDSTKEEGCASRLAEIQTQSDLAAANPALDIVIPDGRARLANLSYRLHLGRAYCGSGDTPRKEELRAAADAALGAVSLYRGLYDYESMAIMQYDAAVTWRLLGDKDKAAAALETAIALDGDYGFGEDAAENAKTLRQWTNEPEPAQPPAPSPKRSITLKFAWNSLDADVAIEADYLDLAGGAVQHSKATVTAERRIRPKGNGWVVISETGDRHYTVDELGETTTPLKQALVTLAAEQMLAPDLVITHRGEFEDTLEEDRVSATMTGDIETAAGKLPPLSEDESKLETPAVIGLSAEFLTRPKGVAFKAQQDYGIEIASWIDATLEQGVWYDMQASMQLPGMPAVLVDHDIQFSYARPVPCGQTECAEILVHATPNPEALQSWLKAIRHPFDLEGPDPAHYASATDFRLVVDPSQLVPYVTEMRRRWYFTLDGKGEPLIGAEKSVSTYSYH